MEQVEQQVLQMIEEKKSIDRKIVGLLKPKGYISIDQSGDWESYNFDSDIEEGDWVSVVIGSEEIDTYAQVTNINRGYDEIEFKYIGSEEYFGGIYETN